jgi:O-antigen ligase
LESSLFFFRFGLLAILISWLLLNYEKFSIIFFSFLMFSFLILFIDGLYTVIFKKNILGYEYDGVRLASFFKDEKILGSYISRLYPVLIFLILYNNINYKNILISLLGYISLILVVLSGERTAIFIFFSFNILSLIFVNNLKKLFFVNFFVSILICIFILIISDPIYERFINTTINGFSADDGKLLIFSENHQNHYLTSLMIFFDNPIFGVGPKMFREVCQYSQYLVYDGCSTHPHNSYMQLLSETGIIGTLPVIIFFLFIVGQLLRFSLQKNNNDTSNISIIYLIIFLNLFPFMPSGNFFNNWLNIVYFIPVGFLIFSIENRK